ncbi:MAG: hypothetical protein E7300_09540 [Lachnospiraceae bacterium]|nr:hypothetical protein [Lachnospiraceae bacterium]
MFFDTNPVEYIKTRWAGIGAPVRRTFVVSYLSAIVAHLYVLTNKFFNYFEMGNIFTHMPFSQEDSLGLGRWFMPVATNLLTYFSMPLVNGLVVFLMLAVSAALIVDMLEIKSSAYGVLFGLIFVTFPGLASIMSYGVNCDLFSSALLLSVLSGYLFVRSLRQNKWVRGVILGAIPLSLSLACYQPYMSVTIGMLYMMLFMQVYRKRTDLKTFIPMVFKSVLMLAAGFILYYVILKIMLTVTGISLSDYHGVDSMTSFTPKGIAKGFVYSYLHFIKYFFTTEYTYTIGRIVCNCIGAATFAALLFRRMRVNRGAVHKGSDATADKTYLVRDRMTNALLLILFLYLPLGVNASPFLMADRVGAGVDRYMIYSLMFLWALLLAMMDDNTDENTAQLTKSRKNLLQWLGGFSVICAIVTGLIITNQAYHRLEATTQATEGLMVRMAARMEQTEGWNKDIPVYFVNPRNMVNSNYGPEVTDYRNLTNLPGTFLRAGYGEEAIAGYMNTYLRFPVKLATEEEIARVEANPAFGKLKAYPDASAVQIIDGVMVVKVSEGETDADLEEN